MITHKFHMLLIAATILYFIFIYQLLKRKRLILKYALTWLLTGMVLIAMALFPSIIRWGAEALGIYSEVNFLFLSIVAFMLIIEMSLTVIVSKISLTNRRLIQKLALLESRIDKLESKIDKLERKANGADNRNTGIQC